MSYQLKNLIKPYDDDYMVYDKVNHRYILSTSHNLIDRQVYGSDTNRLQITLEKISRKIYNFIVANTNSNNFPLIEMVLSCTEDGRRIIKNAMESQLLADMESGQTDISDESAIDFNRGLTIDRNVIRRNRICIDSEDILRNAAKPIKLIYAGDYGVRLSEDRYSQWGY